MLVYNIYKDVVLFVAAGQNASDDTVWDSNKTVAVVALLDVKGLDKEVKRFYSCCT